jgi:acetylornithine deacetylase/succinyl-diaminopimelate desuccinylase-like protein
MLKTPPDGEPVARLSRDPIDNSITHTTCVATSLNAGLANNALPQRAEANVNCRILPGHSAEELRQELTKVFADPAITLRYVDSFGNISDTASGRKSFPPPPLRRPVFGPLEKIMEEMWPIWRPVHPMVCTRWRRDCQPTRSQELRLIAMTSTSTDATTDSASIPTTKELISATAS